MRWVLVAMWMGRAWADCHVTIPPTLGFDCGASVVFEETTYCTNDGNGDCLGAFITLGIGENNMFIRKATFPCSAAAGQCDCRPASDAIEAYCGGLACGAGACAVGDKCCNGKCIPKDSTCCGDGTSCPGACAANGACCPTNLPVFDGNSGYCCGQTDPNNTSTVCLCGNPCPAIQGCCPAGKVCCDKGWCADSAGACPSCPASTPTFCPDGTCAPSGAVCCGRGIYCPNGLSCVDSGAGVIKCGGAGSNPSGTTAPTSSGSTPTRAALQPAGTPAAGTPPTGGTSGTTSSSGGTTSSLPSLTPGCKCQLGGSSTAPFGFLMLVYLMARRRRR